MSTATYEMITTLENTAPALDEHFLNDDETEEDRQEGSAVNNLTADQAARIFRGGFSASPAKTQNLGVRYLGSPSVPTHDSTSSLRANRSPYQNQSFGGQPQPINHYPGIQNYSTSPLPSSAPHSQNLLCSPHSHHPTWTPQTHITCSPSQNYPIGYNGSNAGTINSYPRGVSTSIMGNQATRHPSGYPRRGITGSTMIDGSSYPLSTYNSRMTGCGQPHIISEHYVEHEIRVPKKVVREDIVEKVIVVPETVFHEEVVEDCAVVREKIVEIARTVYQERIVEVPEIEYIERIVEVPERIVQEKLREVPRIEIRERIVEVPKVIMQERIVEVPEIEYVDVPVKKFVEVVEIREQTVLKPVPVPRYVDKPVPEYTTVEINRDVIRNVPIPLEVVTTVNFTVPRLRSTYTKVPVALYVPRFVEIAVPMELMDSQAVAQAEMYAEHVDLVTSQAAASLCEVESLAGTLKDLNDHYASISSKQHDADSVDASMAYNVMANAWLSGKLAISNLDAIPRSNFMCNAPPSSTNGDSAESVEETLHDTASVGDDKFDRNSSENIMAI